MLASVSSETSLAAALAAFFALAAALMLFLVPGGLRLRILAMLTGLMFLVVLWTIRRGRNPRAFRAGDRVRLHRLDGVWTGTIVEFQAAPATTMPDYAVIRLDNPHGEPLNVETTKDPLNRVTREHRWSGLSRRMLG
jgi:hypothetical protein